MSGDLGPKSCLIASSSLPLPSLSWDCLGQTTPRAPRENGKERVLETHHRLPQEGVTELVFLSGLIHSHSPSPLWARLIVISGFGSP